MFSNRAHFQERIREKIAAFNAKKESTQPDVDNIKERFSSYKAEHSRSNRYRFVKLKIPVFKILEFLDLKLEI